MTLDTHAVVLDIPLHPICILPLSDTGMMPDATDGRADMPERRLYHSCHLPPRNRTESQLLSYFSVERRPGLTLQGWQRHLTHALATADDYSAPQGEIAERSRHARPYLFAMMTQVAGGREYASAE